MVSQFTYTVFWVINNNYYELNNINPIMVVLKMLAQLHTTCSNLQFPLFAIEWLIIIVC